MKDPVGGAFPDCTVTANEENVTCVTQKYENGSTVSVPDTFIWFRFNENASMDIRDKFESGGRYRALFEVEAKGTKQITDNTKFIVNGHNAEVVSIGKKGTDTYTARVYYYVRAAGGRGKFGDVDNSGTVDRIDANLLSRYIAGWDGYGSKINTELADMNGDGAVDRIDANILSRCVAAWDGYADHYLLS